MLRPLLSLAALSLACGLASAQAKSPSDLGEVAKKYDLEMVTSCPEFPVKIRAGLIDGMEANKADLESYIPIFISEFSLYPADLVKRSGLKKVVFCQKLSYEKQFRTAIPDFEGNVLYLDVARGRHDETYVRKVIHHEFFHIIDLRDDGKLYEDERWSNLNPASFKYGQGGAKMQNDPSATTSGRDEPGFVNRYATAGVEEDKAEVFAHMIVDPRAIAERVKKDKFMQAKVERMRELLAEFSPRMDQTFWDSIEKCERKATPRR